MLALQTPSESFQRVYGSDALARLALGRSHWLTGDISCAWLAVKQPSENPSDEITEPTNELHPSSFPSLQVAVLFTPMPCMIIQALD